ncbi:MAG: hypothetical protein RLZZ305_703 [Actinomycetota bacterium]
MPHVEFPPPNDLSPSDLAVLGVLVRAQGKVVSRSTILRLGRLRHLAERRCDSCIVAIRRALGADAVVTVRGRGWRLDGARINDANRLLDGQRPTAD